MNIGTHRHSVKGDTLFQEDVFGEYKLRHIDKGGNGVYEKASGPGNIRYVCTEKEHEYAPPTALENDRNGVKEVRKCIILDKNDANHWTVRFKIHPI